MGAAATACEQLFDITPGWPRLQDGPVYSLQIISRMNCGEGWEGTRRVNLHFCSCLNIDYNAFEADLDKGED